MVEICNAYVYKKDVDWSLLNQGFTIPVTYQVVFKDRVRDIAKRGSSIAIKLFIDDNVYEAELKNQAFDEEKFRNHPDILQIRYNPGSALSSKLKSIFHDTYEYLLNYRNSAEYIKKRKILIPEERKEFLAVYTTDIDNVFYVECITARDIEREKIQIGSSPEEEIEFSINYKDIDESARIDEMLVNTKIRRLDRAIGESLKELYDYRCQICGENFSLKYGCNIAEAHHIEYFTKSLNNDAENIIILCPNHHSVVHRVNPVFNSEKLMFEYGNGFREKIRLNLHI